MKCPHCKGTGELGAGEARVGDMILAMRKQKGLTQEEVAVAVGKSRAQIANIESGRSDMPLTTLAKFAKAFDCSMRDLVPE